MDEVVRMEIENDETYNPEVSGEYIIWNIQDQKWITSPNEIRGTTFKFLSGGAEGLAYANTVYKQLVKLIVYRGLPNDMNNIKKFIEEHKKEVNYQQLAARYDLAPAVYRFGFIDDIKDSPFPDRPYFYIWMEYLSPDTWESVFADDIKIQACKFIKDLVSKTHLYNKFDPIKHFYKNKLTGQIKMIDYGMVTECTPATRTNINTCIEEMEKELEIECSSTMTGGRKKYRSNKKTYKKRSRHLSKIYKNKKKKKTRRKYLKLKQKI